ncbi:hypothetical protein [Caballeronia telluris]|uniref:hypothetical protein n=1 Tax=Caballeronia telluris TaxID=326475 RepID=UPI000F748BB6|nr:hypothetical protein [Caballeronia telluris]
MGWVVTAFLAGCSSVGPGFANHPADCAIGIPWADCLPGTRGYANGGGSYHRVAAKAQRDALAAKFDDASKQCETEMATPELLPLRDKIQFSRKLDDAPPFQYSSLDVFPSAVDRPLIARWATIRDGCIQRESAIEIIPPDATPLDATRIKQERAFGQEAEAKVSELVLALYQQKLTYGEFALRRYLIGKAAVDAARQYREARLLQDQERQIQTQQVASQQFANTITAWTAYMQTVNARRPQTVNLTAVTTATHCTSVRSGNVVDTNCR